jgi:hypothetical protein
MVALAALKKRPRSSQRNPELSDIRAPTVSIVCQRARDPLVHRLGPRPSFVESRSLRLVRSR